jgi:leader peptidase (prepilin peptidase) / N-methyltransferase
VNLIITVPLEFRMAALFVLGTILGSFANLGAYRLAWHARPISPWSRPDPDRKTPPRHWADRVPIFGWLGLRREASLHGAGFWIRPLLVELLAGFGLAWLYWWEIDRLGLLSASTPRPVLGAWMTMLHVQFAVHVLLIWLMLVASLIDADEKTIPDAITVSGTLVALVVAAAYPLSLLPDLAIGGAMVLPRGFWRIVTPETWPLMFITAPVIMPPWLGGFPNGGSLAVGLGCWWLWCFGLMRRDWRPRHGIARAVRLFVARLCREASTWRIVVLGLVGTAAIVAVWFSAGRNWDAMITALVGMAAAGGLVWAVRIIGTAVLRREAMGFGDVTLMAMIGAFLGWQASILIFVFAPFAALAIGLFILILFRDREIPYGPFLCMATLVVLVRWSSVWEWASPILLQLGLLVPAVIVFCLPLLAVLLGLIQVVKRLFHRAG